MWTEHPPRRAPHLVARGDKGRISVHRSRTFPFSVRPLWGGFCVLDGHLRVSGLQILLSTGRVRALEATGSGVRQCRSSRLRGEGAGRGPPSHDSGSPPSPAHKCLFPRPRVPFLVAPSHTPSPASISPVTERTGRRPREWGGRQRVGQGRSEGTEAEAPNNKRRTVAAAAAATP